MKLAQLRALAHYGFPFSVGATETPVARRRALGFPARFAATSPIKRWLAYAGMTLLWPLGAWSDARRDMRALAAQDSQVDRSTIQRDMYRLALKYNIPPLEYRLYHLNEPTGRAEMHQYLYWTDLPALAALNARRGANNRDVQDKSRFAEICARCELPHVETLAVFDQGKQVVPDMPFAREQPRIFFKSLRGKGSMNVEIWTRNGNVYCSTQGESLPPARLAERLRQTDCIVQPYLENHSALEPLTNGALATLRVVTGIDHAGSAEFICALLNLPYGQLKSSTSGIIFRIDPTSGILTRAYQLRSRCDLMNHPDTGAPLFGFTLPFWRESVALVKRAHALAFARFVFLGWDVALTENGPVLLETKGGWGALHHQMLDGPIGRTAFSRLVEEHLQRHHALGSDDIERDHVRAN